MEWRRFVTYSWNDPRIIVEMDRQTDIQADILAMSGGDNPVAIDNITSALMFVLVLKTTLPGPRVRYCFFAFNDAI